jgi:uncharacterized protein (DUF433 family)
MRYLPHPKETISNFRAGQLMPQLERITFDPNVMGGKPCIRGMRITVGTIVSLIANGATQGEIFADDPYLEPVGEERG